MQFSLKPTMCKLSFTFFFFLMQNGLDKNLQKPLNSKDFGSVQQQAGRPPKPKHATDGPQQQADLEPLNVLSILMSPAESPPPPAT